MYIHRLAEKILEKYLAADKITVILGARQVGKTTLVERIVKERGGVILNMDLEVDKARFMAGSFLDPKEAMKIYGNPQLLVIDEAQKEKETGRIVKGWYDSKTPVKFILLGSSSVNLLDKTVEGLTGRNLKLNLPPLLFAEVLKSQKWYSFLLSPGRLHKIYEKQISTLLIQTIVYGLYPESIVGQDREAYLLNLTADYLLKDVTDQALIRSQDTLKKLLLLLAYQTGSEVSVNELSSSLNISRQTVERYLDLLERTFVIFRLGAYSSNLRKEIVKNKKIFFWDTGVRNALLKEFSQSVYRSDIGHLWENWIIAEFAKKNALAGQPNNLYFWRSGSGAEVDLVVKGTHIFKAYEIKWSGKASRTGRSFTNKYQIPVTTINRDNFLTYIFD